MIISPGQALGSALSLPRKVGSNGVGGCGCGCGKGGGIVGTPRYDRGPHRASLRLLARRCPRDRDEIAGFFRGLELVDPGVVNISDWRPRPGTSNDPAILWGAVARK
ncbi:MAG TPA: SAM-dependent methyltransferase [Trebonia sp.]|nr:SAM-dependent methyltransferase [Trebonia sp.]